MYNQCMSCELCELYMRKVCVIYGQVCVLYMDKIYVLWANRTLISIHLVQPDLVVCGMCRANFSLFTNEKSELIST